MNCKSGARQFAKFSSAVATGAGVSTVALAAVGAEPAAAFTGAVTLGADLATLYAGAYIWYSEGDSSVLKSSAIGAAGGAVGGVLMRGFGGSMTKAAPGVIVSRQPSNAAVEGAKLGAGAGASYPIGGICP